MAAAHWAQLGFRKKLGRSASSSRHVQLGLGDSGSVGRTLKGRAPDLGRGRGGVHVGVAMAVEGPRQQRTT